MARVANGPDFGRAATSRSLMLKELYNFFEFKEPLGGNKSE